MAHNPVPGEDQGQIDRNNQQAEIAGNTDLPPATQTEQQQDDAQAKFLRLLNEGNQGNG